MAERPVAHVPRWVIGLLAVALAAQVAVHQRLGPPRAAAQDLPSPPRADLLRLASLGEPQALGKLLMLYIQAFDYQAGTLTPYRDLDYVRLGGWLKGILALDPNSQYPLLLAARVYAEVKDPAKRRLMLDLIHEEYLLDPNRRWQWLAEATLVAKHQLKDLTLARTFAAALQTHTTTPEAPVWVKQMEVFILEDMNELEAARIMLGGLIASGQVKDARDMALLEQRLKTLEARIEAERPPNPSSLRREADVPGAVPTHPPGLKP